MAPSVLALGSLAGCRHLPSSDVVATVNSKDISRAELDRAYKNYMLSMGQSSQQPTPEQADILRLQILRQMIDDEVLQQRAAKLNLAASDEDVNARLTEMKTPYTEE
ncbi:MAG TPA: SurA N-terminal domain-containing protein, partial [Terracidiphilus sp.]|nr:SurA N-terminal domain-containing protein [Terracidiphilus sp.]